MKIFSTYSTTFSVSMRSSFYLSDIDAESVAAHVARVLDFSTTQTTAIALRLSRGVEWDQSYFTPAEMRALSGLAKFCTGVGVSIGSAFTIADLNSGKTFSLIRKERKEGQL